MDDSTGEWLCRMLLTPTSTDPKEGWIILTLCQQVTSKHSGKVFLALKYKQRNAL